MKIKIIAILAFCSLNMLVFAQNSWDVYRKKLSEDDKALTFAAIYGLDGKVYSAPADSKISQGEIKSILDVFANPGMAINKDITINKAKYKVAKADKTSIRGGAGSVSFEIMKTKKVVIVAIGKSPTIRDAVERLGNWLVQNGS